MSKPLKLTNDVKREAFLLSLAIEGLIYGYDERVGMAALVALTAAFNNLCEVIELEDAQTMFHQLLATVTSPTFALEEDDPVTRNYVFPDHETVQ